MNKLTLTLVLAFAVAFFSQCKKECNKQFETFFCTSLSAGEAPLQLFIDGEYKGNLPTIETLPACGDEAKNDLLHLQLNSGKYDLEVRDESGKVLSASYLKLSSGSVGVGSGPGGSEANGDNDACVTVRLF